MRKNEKLSTEAESSFRSFKEYTNFLMGICWSDFKTFSEYLGFVGQALEFLVEKGLLSPPHQGFEVRDSAQELDYSWNFIHKGERLYFTKMDDVREFLNYIAETPIGKQLSSLRPESHTMDKDKYSTRLPVKVLEKR
jgi:hypothetical protein